MKVLSLSLRHFRIYREATFNFGPGATIIVGPNASGKTTILEALFLLITGRSFRTNSLTDLIYQDERMFHVEAVVEKHGVEQTLRFTYDGQKRTIRHNDTICPSTSALLGILQGAVMTPDDVALIKGAPSLRRRFLDIQLAQVDPQYVAQLSRYTRAMKQRNALLRDKNTEVIGPWEEEMAKAASYIVTERRRLISELKDRCVEVQKVLSQDKEDLSLHYKTTAPMDPMEISPFYLEQYRESRGKEVILKSTSIGPHRDDLLIKLQGHEARHFGSEGQQRSIVTALKFAEWSRLKDFTDESPLMFIDDVGVSFDEHRRQAFFSLTDSFSQVFLTTTEINDRTIKGDIISVNQGVVVEPVYGISS